MLINGGDGGQVVSSTTSLQARDGDGNPVDWFFVLKLPQFSFPVSKLPLLELPGFRSENMEPFLFKRHCSCPDPTCRGMPFPEYGSGRGSGLCYYYADSNNPKLRYFSDAGLECLGQGGKDPVSQTLLPLYANGGAPLRAPNIEWAFWNDQFAATADSRRQDVCAYSSYSPESLPYKPCASNSDCGKRCHKKASHYRPCSSNDDCASGDKCKQVSCKSRQLPHYNAGCSAPHGHAKGAMAFAKGGDGFWLQASTPQYPDPSLGTKFVPLGCQLDNNLKVAQHFTGVSMTAATFTKIAPALAAAQLCSAGSTSCRNGTAGHLWSHSCTSEHTRSADWSILDIAFTGSTKSSAPSVGIPIVAGAATQAEIMGKAAADHVPPWYWVATHIKSDIAVSSWLDGSYGSPSICKGDDYSHAAFGSCLRSSRLGLSLTPSGGAQQSVQNVLGMRDPKGRFAWGAWGELNAGFVSHAKFAVGTPNKVFVAGGMNQQGFPCSSSCKGSQAGRGGLFFAIPNAQLRDSAAALMHYVCTCDKGSQSSKRFCNFGCGWKPAPFSRPMPVPKQLAASPGFASKAWAASSNCKLSTTQRKGYDHQTKEYLVKYAAATSSSAVTVQPFFSPDTSAPTLVDLITGAKSSIAIMTPSASAWDSYNCASPAAMRSDSFPVFSALLNALIRGVRVQILTNNFGEDCAPGTIKMLLFLRMNGAEVRFYASTTFLHAKLLSVDGWTKVAVSSVNWSHSSYENNREAGAVLSGDAVLASMMRGVYDGDWAIAAPMAAPAPSMFNSSARAVITAKSPVAVKVPTRKLLRGCFAVEAFSFEAAPGSVTVVASPDHAFQELTARLDGAQDSIEIYMYQIFGEALVGALKRAHARGITITLLVSANIYSGCDCFDARAAYASLTAAGITVRKSSPTCTKYQHQKFWIVDQVDVGWSTGNWDNADYPSVSGPARSARWPRSGAVGQTVFPPIPSAHWTKANRDFTVYVDDAAALVGHFREVLTKDSSSPSAADWQPWSDIQCGPANPTAAAAALLLPSPSEAGAPSGHRRIERL